MTPAVMCFLALPLVTITVGRVVADWPYRAHVSCQIQQAVARCVRERCAHEVCALGAVSFKQLSSRSNYRSTQGAQLQRGVVGHGCPAQAGAKRSGWHGGRCAFTLPRRWPSHASMVLTLCALQNLSSSAPFSRCGKGNLLLK